MNRCQGSGISGGREAGMCERQSVSLHPSTVYPSCTNFMASFFPPFWKRILYTIWKHWYSLVPKMTWNHKAVIFWFAPFRRKKGGGGTQALSYIRKRILSCTFVARPWYCKRNIDSMKLYLIRKEVKRNWKRQLALSNGRECAVLLLESSCILA